MLTGFAAAVTDITDDIGTVGAGLVGLALVILGVIVVKGMIKR